ncbi:MAG: TonB-dependent receptor, partial [Gemmatimonadetes bacterium]|nr:TonB-dependent receptor [Gemmatimonadota bacterium]
ASVSAQLDVTDFFSVYGSFAEGFNAPRLLDLYITGLHFPGSPVAMLPDNFFVPNPALEPERTESFEGGVKLGLSDLLSENDGLRFELAMFDMNAEDFIAREVDVGAGTTTFRNLDRVDITGVEALARYETRSFFGGISFGRVRMDDLVDEEPVDDAPADTWVLDAGLRLADRQLTIGYRGQFANDQDRVTDEELATPGYGVSDVYAQVAPRTGPFRAFELGVFAENVFDKTYRRHGSFIPALGRALRVQVAWRGGWR